MTEITIDLTDDEIEAVRKNHAHIGRSYSPLWSAAQKLYAALPPKELKPVAGGRCKTRSDTPHVKGQWEILYVDDKSIVVRLIWRNEIACISYGPDDFHRYFEVTE